MNACVQARFLFGLLAALPLLFAGPRHETLRGKVIAHSSVTLCLNGNAYGSLLVRREKSKPNAPQFLRIEFSAPCDSPAASIFGSPNVRKFHLIRYMGCDSTLDEFLPVEPAGPTQLKAWKLTTASDASVLPYGISLPCYHFASKQPKPVL